MNVSTHSRLKAAGNVADTIQKQAFGFNTQPPKGGWDFSLKRQTNAVVSTHSRLKAAGYSQAGCQQSRFVSTHSRLKAAGS